MGYIRFQILSHPFYFIFFDYNLEFSPLNAAFQILHRLYLKFNIKLNINYYEKWKNECYDKNNVIAHFNMGN